VVLAYLAANAPASATEAVLNREDLAPRTRLLEMFTALAAGDRTVPDPLVAALVEYPNGAHVVHQAAAGHAQRFNERLTALARESGARDPERTARRLVTLYDGACCRLLVEDVATVVADAYAMAASVLRDAID